MIHTDFMRMDPAYADALRACGLDTPARVLDRVEGEVVAWSRTTETLHIANPAGGPGFYLKRYRYPRWKNRLRGALRGTFIGSHRGLAEFRTLQAMRAAGVPAVRPVAYGARRVAHFVSTCFLITEETPASTNLTSFAQRHLAGTTIPMHTRRSAVDALAAAVAHMHAAGCEHGQLFWRNILVRPAAHAPPEFFFLDPQPQPIRRMGRGDRWWRRELACLLVSARSFTTAGERLRFFLRYSGAERLTPDMKPALRDIAERAGRWCRHEAQRVRMNGLFSGWLAQLEAESRPAEPAP
ncbi:MAG: hypothetical protein IPM64_16010 [Phycisphaerales bacterium]|nr:hypothetical protein [Phycisphaerales bacterium]